MQRQCARTERCSEVRFQSEVRKPEERVDSLVLTQDEAIPTDTGQRDQRKDADRGAAAKMPGRGGTKMSKQKFHDRHVRAH